MSREMSCPYKTFYRCPTYGDNCGEKCRIYRETHQTKENIIDEEISELKGEQE